MINIEAILNKSRNTRRNDRRRLGVGINEKSRHLQFQRPLQLKRIAQGPESLYLPWQLQRRAGRFHHHEQCADRLQFSGTTYPISATSQGKASIQINRASEVLTAVQFDWMAQQFPIPAYQQSKASYCHHSLRVYWEGA